MKLRHVSLVLSAFWFVACSKEPHVHTPGDGHGATTGTVKDDHAGDGHGALTPLGTIKLGDLVVQVAQEGAATPGHEVGIDLTFEKGKRPETVRAWVGLEAATGSVKAKLGKEGDAVLHAHIEMPKPLPAGSLLWVEREATTGTVKASIALK